MPVCADLQDIAVLVDQHRARQIARGGACGQQLAKRSAILIVQRPGVGDIVGHSQNIAANELRRARAGRRVATISEFWITSRVGPENSRSRPRSMVTLATIATSTAGNTAMTENRLTIWTCSLAAARPRRRAWTTFQTSRTMMPTSSRMVAALISRKVTTTSRVGSIGSGPSAPRRSGSADSSARPTANGASSLRRDQPLGFGERRIERCGRGVCAGHSRQRDEMKALRGPPGPRTDAFISQCCQFAKSLRYLRFNHDLTLFPGCLFEPCSGSSRPL